jgi:glucose/arabinose dehydrogenase
MFGTRGRLFVALLVAALAALGCSGEDPAPTESPSASATASAEPSATATTASPTPSGTTPGASGLAAPPWSAAPLAQTQVPAVLVTEWSGAENKSSCAALAPDTLGAEGSGAIARRASFAGGWAVAWDKAGLPGTTAGGDPCTNCGRSAFGVAGTGLTGDTADQVKALTNNWPNSREWSDGSRAGYGPEGETGPRLLAQLYVQGQACLYNVWSSVSQSHLELLLDHLRFVGGAGAPA